MVNLNHFSYVVLNNQTELLLRCKAFLIENNKDKTFTHVYNVALISQQLAEHFNVDSNKAYTASLLHDISAILNPTDMMIIAKDNNIVLDEAEIKYPFLLHQKISALIAKDYFMIEDFEILNAIAYHTTLKANPTPLEMIVFLADKIAWDQDGQPPYLDKLKEHLQISLESACQYYLNYLFAEGKLLYPHQDIIEAHKYFNQFNL